jgi:hypothetical protein
VDLVADARVLAVLASCAVIARLIAHPRARRR